MIMLRVGIQEKPPLLQMYILPSGPRAAPLGPPGICATTSFRPSGYTRVSLLPRISTSTTEPSGIATGPSGNSRSVASTRSSAINPLPAFLHATLGQSHSRLQATATHLPRNAGLPGDIGQIYPWTGTQT